MKFGTAFIDIKTRFDKRQMAGMQQQIQGTISGLAGQVGLGVFGGMGAMAIVNGMRRITRAAGVMGLSVLKAGADAFEAENLFDVSMENMAADARTWSESYAKSLRLSAFEVRELVGNMQLMLVGMGHTTDAAFPMSKRMTELAIDLASIKNVPVEEAFAKIRSGIAGVIRPLRNWGFSLSAAEVKQVAFAIGITKANKEMTEQEKQLARMVLLIHKTRQVHGDMARTMNSAANMWRAFNTAITDTKKLAGFEALPGLERLLRVLVDLTQRGAPFRKSMIEAGKSLGTMANFSAKGLSGWVREWRRTGEKIGPIFTDITTLHMAPARLLAKTGNAVMGAIAGAAVAESERLQERFRKEGLMPGAGGVPGQTRQEYLARHTQRMQELAARGQEQMRREEQAEMQETRDAAQRSNTQLISGMATSGLGAFGGTLMGSTPVPLVEPDSGPQSVAFDAATIKSLTSHLQNITLTVKQAEEE